MKTLGYYNGKFDEIENMTVPMLDRGCYFGDGVYDATYARNHKIFALEEHVDRFFRSAGLLDIKISQSKEEICHILREMVKKVDSPDQFVYWQATRGTAMRNHVYSEDMRANIWIMLKPGTIQDNFKTVDLRTAEDTRFYHCNVKTLNLIPSVMAATAADRDGLHETVLHRGERVTECSHCNVHIIKDGVFRTAPTDCLILPGIARAHLIGICKNNNIPVDETAFTVAEMMDADEVILSSVTGLCLAAATVDGKAVGGKAPELLDFLRRATLEEWYEATDI